MNIATLRLSGTDEALEALVNTLKLEQDAIWNRGDPFLTRDGQHESSGLNANIVETKDSKTLVEKLRAFFLKCQANHVTFARACNCAFAAPLG